MSGLGARIDKEMWDKPFKQGGPEDNFLFRMLLKTVKSKTLLEAFIGQDMSLFELLPFLKAAGQSSFFFKHDKKPAFVNTKIAKTCILEVL